MLSYDITEKVEWASTAKTATFSKGFTRRQVRYSLRLYHFPELSKRKLIHFDITRKQDGWWEVDTCLTMKGKWYLFRHPTIEKEFTDNLLKSLDKYEEDFKSV